LGFIALVMVVFIGRLLELQGLDTSAYAEQAEKQRIRTVTLHATRGDITDRNGLTLATTVDARAVSANPRLVQKSTSTTPAKAAEELAPLLGVPAAELQTKLESDRSFIYLAHGISPEVAKQVLGLKITSVNVEPESKRLYPNGTLAANVLGFVGAEGKGLGGLEFAKDALLAGKDGTAQTEIGRDGRPIPDGYHFERPAVAGTSLRLTLDRDIQWAAQQAIADQVQATGAANGSVIVMDPTTGQILALATAPSFDPGNVGASPESDRGNRPVSEVFEPGSTAKVITMAAAMDSGVLKPDSILTVPPTITVAGHTIHDAEHHGEERLTLTEVLAKSSNIGTVLAAQELGKDRLYSYLKSFGLGESSGLGFPGESKGILTAPSKWWGSQQYTIAFGQGVAVTAIQVASVFATIANNGVRSTPTLLLGEVGDSGAVKPVAAGPSRRVISQQTARQLTAMLESAASEQGTAPLARVPGYRVAGKTGTAQRVDPDCQCYRGYTSSFVGFAPADSPRLVVAVVLSAPTKGHYGGEIAAPVFRNVMAFSLQSMKIPPTQVSPSSEGHPVATPSDR
jgi:cell division protein FtsI (penicillin-binding protein 3)